MRRGCPSDCFARPLPLSAPPRGRRSEPGAPRRMVHPRRNRLRQPERGRRGDRGAGEGRKCRGCRSRGGVRSLRFVPLGCADRRRRVRCGAPRRRRPDRDRFPRDCPGLRGEGHVPGT